jgi:hypothetical protein
MIDISKNYRTREGREVRIYATGSGGIYPTHGAILREERTWLSECWTANGRYGANVVYDDPKDLIEVKPRHKRTVWLNLYPDPDVCFGYASERNANEGSDSDRIACIKVELDFEEGEGL